jgi:hypothetical protein
MQFFSVGIYCTEFYILLTHLHMLEIWIVVNV